MFQKRSLLLLVSTACCQAAELRVNTDFEGGSARVEAIDQQARVIRLMPGGDPQRGWPCWWYLRVEGVEKDERVTIDLGGSDLPARNNGQDTGKPLEPKWAMPMKASFSTDEKTWQYTSVGRRVGRRILYEVTGTGGPLWIAWGPPFTPRDTDALFAESEKSLSSAKGFELAKTREGRPVRALHLSGSAAPPTRAVWIQARAHAWESGASWVARGFVEWLVSDDAAARSLREGAEVVVVPILDVDNVATGNGGKEAAPRDHNRDWDEQPVYPEITATQQRLRAWKEAGRLDLFIDLHNPGFADPAPFFFVGPEEMLAEAARENRARFVNSARRHLTGPLALEEKTRVTGPKYHPLWRQMSAEWVSANGDPQTVAICLETAWNTPHSDTNGYRTVGRQLGQAIAEYLQKSSADRP